MPPSWVLPDTTGPQSTCDRRTAPQHPSTPVDATEAQPDRSFGNAIGRPKFAHSATATDRFADVAPPPVLLTVASRSPPHTTSPPPLPLHNQSIPPTQDVQYKLNEEVWIRCSTARRHERDKMTLTRVDDEALSLSIQSLTQQKGDTSFVVFDLTFSPPQAPLTTRRYSSRIWNV